VTAFVELAFFQLHGIVADDLTEPELSAAERISGPPPRLWVCRGSRPR
jgi:hypothetical protein